MGRRSDPFDFDFDYDYEKPSKKRSRRRSRNDDDTLSMRDAFDMTMGAIAFGTAAHIGLSVVDRVGRR